MALRMRLWSLVPAVGAVLLALVGTAAARDAGVGVVDPGLKQPGMAGIVGGVARRSVRR